MKNSSSLNYAAPPSYHPAYRRSTGRTIAYLLTASSCAILAVVLMWNAITTPGTYSQLQFFLFWFAIPVYAWTTIRFVEKLMRSQW
jgi:hypothetical protein